MPSSRTTLVASADRTGYNRPHPGPGPPATATIVVPIATSNLICVHDGRFTDSGGGAVLCTPQRPGVRGWLQRALDAADEPIARPLWRVGCWSGEESNRCTGLCRPLPDPENSLVKGSLSVPWGALGERNLGAWRGITGVPGQCGRARRRQAAGRQRSAVRSGTSGPTASRTACRAGGIVLVSEQPCAFPDRRLEFQPLKLLPRRVLQEPAATALTDLCVDCLDHSSSRLTRISSHPLWVSRRCSNYAHGATAARIESDQASC